MVLEHYKTELELAQYVSKLEAQVKGYKALCERLQAQADEMRGGRAITSAAQLAELIDGVRCFNDLGAELIAEAVFEQLPDHIPDTTKMVESQWISVEDRLPDEQKAEYLCLFDGGHQQVTEWLHDETDGWVFWYGDPTHWMPLPAAPTPTNGDSHD